MNKFLDPNLENLQTTLQNKFEIPVYQRPYKWEKEQIEELFEDMIPEIEAEGIFFLGTVFLNFKEFYSSNKPIYEIVDGQQRITTLSLLLMVLYARLYEEGCDENNVDLKSIKDILWKKKNYQNQRDGRLIVAGNLERTTLENIFNWCLDKPKDFIDKIKEEYSTNSSVFDKVFYSNIISINECIDKYILESDKVFLNLNVVAKLSCFFHFLMDNVDVIAITMQNSMHDDRKKLFEIFESINAKGRKLEEIDLIKSYIFQNINDKDYDQYLSKWGELIKKTNDRLEDYLSVFINAKIKVYRISIKIRNFKSLSSDEMMSFYKKDNLSDTLEAFIDEMVFYVDKYKKLVDKEEYICDNSKFKFYMTALRYINYSHPKALLFRVYCDYQNNIVNKPEMIDLTRNVFEFMFLYQTLQQRDSKETSSVFEGIMNDIIKKSDNNNYCQEIIDTLKKNLSSVAIDKNKILSLLKEHIGYENQAKNETKVLLAAYELRSAKGFSYDEMTMVLKEPKIQVDHISAKKPDKTNDNYPYYPEKKIDGKEIVKFKKPCDFAQVGGVVEGIDYDVFLSRTLHRTGNLQLLWKQKNIDKSNGVIKLPNYPDFNTFNQIENRANSIADVLVNNGFFELLND